MPRQRAPERENVLNIAEQLTHTASPVWFITGAATGLGRAVAEAALEQGHRVVASARNAAKRLEDLTSRYPETCRAAELDVTDKEQAAAAVRLTLDAFGRVDSLLNNAGITQAIPLEDISEAQIRLVIETNLFGELNVTRAFLPVLREQKSGHILNVSSLAGRVSHGGYSIYSATKFGVAGFSEALAEELKPFGVVVTTIFPATYQTNIINNMLRHEPTEPYSEVYKFLQGFMQKQSDLPDAHNLRGYARAVLEVAESESPPLKIVIGSGGAKAIRQKLEDEIKELDRWCEVSAYTNAT